MRLVGHELKKRCEEFGVSVDELAEAVQRTGLSTRQAASAVKNWMRGVDHPRCKKADIERMAEVIGCEAKDIARFTSQVRFHRGSQKKAVLVADMIRGRGFDDANQMLQFSPKRAAVNLRKALNAAFADAQEAGADQDLLFVSECRVDRGAHIKRFRPKDRGRAHPILKRTSHITVSVEERR